ncbi:MAG: hypothetical protein ACXVA9_09605 [Bdellovibrionales bacterium]
MSESLDLRILQHADKQAIMEFAKRQLASRIEDPTEREMQSWSARWREESLDHYLPLGWSFGAYKGDALTGFILGQPLLFFRGLTQTLWLESIEALSPQIHAQLIDCAQRWARDKHLQCALMEGVDGKWHEIKTARFT